MRRVFATILIGCLALPLNLSVAEAAVKPGSACKKLGQIKKSEGIKYTCIKSGKKLVWKKGTAIKSPTPTPTPTPTEKSFLVPLAPTGANVITWQNIEARASEISAVAWQNVQDTIQTNSTGTNITSLKVLYAPLTPTTHYPGFQDFIETGIKLWNRFTLPPETTFLVYSYAEIAWAAQTITKILVDSGSDQNRAERTGNDLANAPYGSADCGGANAGMVSNTQAIGVFALCPRNEGTDPYYKGPLQVHEFTHQIQGAQFIGSRLNQQQVMPCWISEGLAHAGGLAAGTKSLQDYLEVRKRQASSPTLRAAREYVATLIKASDLTEEYLKKFYIESSSPNCLDLPSFSLGYSVGFLTTEALAAIGGMESTMLLYTRTANGETFADAFEKIYGITWSDAQSILAKVISKQFSRL